MSRLPSLPSDSTTKTLPPGSTETKVLQLNDFLCGASIDNLNLRKLLLFAEKSRLVQKVRYRRSR